MRRGKWERRRGRIAASLATPEEEGWNWLLFIFIVVALWFLATGIAGLSERTAQWTPRSHEPTNICRMEELISVVVITLHCRSKPSSDCGCMKRNNKSSTIIISLWSMSQCLAQLNPADLNAQFHVKWAFCKTSARSAAATRTCWTFNCKGRNKRNVPRVSRGEILQRFPARSLSTGCHAL